MQYARNALCTACCLSLLACGGGDDLPDVAPLPARPQLLPDPNSQDGVVLFRLTTAGQTTVENVVFVNGGRETLHIDRIGVAGDAGGVFSVGDVVPDSREIESRGALSVAVAFAPTERGVTRATMVIESNAENFPMLELELLGPGAANPPDQPDIAAVEETVTLPAGQTRVAAFFLNIGQPVLEVSRYNIAEGGSGAFALAAGTANPSAACGAAAECFAGLTCTEGTCSPVRVPGGSPVAVLLNYTGTGGGSHQDTLRVESNDADTPVLSFSITTGN